MSIADVLDRQGVRLRSTWRATWIALGGRGLTTYLVGELATAAPIALFAILASARFEPAYLTWTIPIGLAWASRDGHLTAFGCLWSAVAILAFGTLGATIHSSALHVLGAFCVTWVWFVGGLTRGVQKHSIVEHLARDPGLYKRLRESGAITGPVEATFETLNRETR